MINLSDLTQVTDTQCNQVPHETCEQVPKQRCSSTPKEVCTNVSCYFSASPFSKNTAINSSGARNQMQEGALGEMYRSPSWEVPASTRAKVHSGWYKNVYKRICCFVPRTGSCSEVLGRAQRTLHGKDGRFLVKHTSLMSPSCRNVSKRGFART